MNARIEQTLTPINELRGAITETRLSIKKGIKKEVRAERVETLRQQKAQLQEMISARDDKILKGEIGLDMLEGKPNLTKEQFQASKKVREPLTLAEERLRLAEKNGDRLEIKKAKEARKVAKKELAAKLEAGAIAPELFRQAKSGRRYLINEGEVPRLRRMTPEGEMRGVAERTLDTILQQNDEQMAGQIFDAVSAGGANPLKTRTLLWNDAQAEKWLINDMNVLGPIYGDQLSKRIYMDDVLTRYGIDPKEGAKGFAKHLKEEHTFMRQEILDKFPNNTKERAKLLKKLDKDLKSATDDVRDAYAVYMGNYTDSSAKVARIANTIKQFNASALLGNMPILMLTEFFTPMFRFAFSEYVVDGLIPMLSQFKKMASDQIKDLGKGNESIVRGAFADVGLGNNVALGARNAALFGYGTQYQPKTLVERYVQNLAGATQNVSLANHVADVQETTVAFASQAKTIRTLKRWSDGAKLTEQEIARLDILRLNPAEWGERILKQVAEFGEEMDGSFISNFHKWTDNEACNIFKIGIEKETRSVITKPNMLDIPLCNARSDTLYDFPVLIMALSCHDELYAACHDRFRSPKARGGISHHGRR